MNVLEAGFEYQMEEILKDMAEDYRSEMEDEEERSMMFHEWLWRNREDFGAKVYEALDAWSGIEEFTEPLNDL